MRCIKRAYTHKKAQKRKQCQVYGHWPYQAQTGGIDISNMRRISYPYFCLQNTINADGWGIKLSTTEGLTQCFFSSHGRLFWWKGTKQSKHSQHFMTSWRMWRKTWRLGHKRPTSFVDKQFVVAGSLVVLCLWFGEEVDKKCSQVNWSGEDAFKVELLAIFDSEGREGAVRRGEGSVMGKFGEVSLVWLWLAQYIGGMGWGGGAYLLRHLSAFDRWTERLRRRMNQSFWKGGRGEEKLVWFPGKGGGRNQVTMLIPRKKGSSWCWYRCRYYLSMWGSEIDTGGWVAAVSYNHSSSRLLHTHTLLFSYCTSTASIWALPYFRNWFAFQLISGWIASYFRWDRTLLLLDIARTKKFLFVAKTVLDFQSSNNLDCLKVFKQYIDCNCFWIVLKQSVKAGLSSLFKISREFADNYSLFSDAWKSSWKIVNVDLESSVFYREWTGNLSEWRKSPKLCENIPAACFC